MKQRRLRWMMLVFALGAIMMLGACKKKVAPPPPPPPPAPAAPTASLTANPNTMEKGQSTTLTWQTSNATDASIDGIGAVQPNGSQSVSPSRLDDLYLDCEGAGWHADKRQPSNCHFSATAASSSLGYRRRTVLTNCEGHLLRLRQERYQRRPAVFDPGRY